MLCNLYFPSLVYIIILENIFKKINMSNDVNGQPNDVGKEKNMAKCTIGIDFGTLSARAALVNVDTGNVIATASQNYEHAVIDDRLSTGQQLKTDWALQVPNDYKEAMIHSVKAVLTESQVDPEDVIAIGTDFTACTILPIYEDGTPLHEDEQFYDRPHAYAKLWKHHAAERYADKLTSMAEESGETFLKRYGGKISSEWELPKVWQIMEEDPEVYERADHIVEAGDWISFLLTGQLTKSSCGAGYKGTWHAEEGYPDQEFLNSLHPLFADYVTDKMNFPVYNPGEVCGYLTEEMANTLGLKAGIPVSPFVIDAMASFPATGITGAGQMQAAIGTSTCQIVLADQENYVPGITGVVYGGVYPNIYAYETGQAAVGDIFAWFVDNLFPQEYVIKAKDIDMSPHAYLNSLASQLQVGESGLVALDWWNGNRSILSNYDLSGLLVGMTLATTPEEIYRALIEATAYGTRVLIENHKDHGVDIHEYIAAGGISTKSPLAMQIYADVLNMPISVADVPEGAAVGSAIYAAAAAGEELGGYASIYEAAEKMGKVKKHAFKPIPEHVDVYEKLYREYLTLHDYFGRSENNTMINLKNIRINALENKTSL